MDDIGFDNSFSFIFSPCPGMQSRGEFCRAGALSRADGRCANHRDSDVYAARGSGVLIKILLSGRMSF